ncbi:MAG: class I SAM-dependent methyltransferase [Thermoguttaceae bacterium]|nr:class I SAM-dependent methyltransferase [Thermoguttaceae bacterium]
MEITQTFYNAMASQYDKLFQDWQSTTREQALILDRIFIENGFDRTAQILDCACGIGTQAIGLASLGYRVTASDISDGELAEARDRAEKNGVRIRFEHADFRALSDVFKERFDVVIAMDNALPHMLSSAELEKAVASVAAQIKPGGIAVVSIRDYDSLLAEKPPYSPPYVHKTEKGRRVSFQTWDWKDDRYRLTQYIVEDEGTLRVGKFECEYRATRREELSALFRASGCSDVVWKFPEETGFYQPIAVAGKRRLQNPSEGKDHA